MKWNKSHKMAKSHNSHNQQLTCSFNHKSSSQIASLSRGCLHWCGFAPDFICYTVSHLYLEFFSLILIIIIQRVCKSNVITVICDTAAFPKVHIWYTYIPEHSRAYNRRPSKVEVNVSICVNIVASVFRLYLAALLTDADSKTTQQSLWLIGILQQFDMQQLTNFPEFSWTEFDVPLDILQVISNRQ